MDNLSMYDRLHREQKEPLMKRKHRRGKRKHKR